MQELVGVVESIIFKNNDNGYTIGKVKTDKNEQITIVGHIPYLTEGHKLKLSGEWVLHHKFGKQFSVTSAEEIIPSTLDGIEKYLSSGIIMGIGPITAKKIVDKFGEEALKVLEEAPDRLLEIEGLGEKRINIIVESYNKQRDVRNVMMFLQNYGVTPNQCLKIYKKFNNRSIEVVKDNPYILTEEISGIGFKTADKIARSLGIDLNSPFRIQSGIKYVINGFCALGHTFMPMNDLIKEGMSILGVSKEDLEKSIYDGVIDEKIKVEEVQGIKCVFTIPFYYCEISVTKKIVQLSLNKYEKLKVDITKKIKNFEKEKGINFAESQKEAIKGAIENGVEIITGGPGTGKTTIINCILDIFEEEGLRVFMAAPTGRAAKRMTEATGRESKTIHRLLEMGMSDDDSGLVYSKSEDTPLECDVVIIDEASMVDIMLMNNLLKAISMGTRLIIVGDVDQLPSVGPGNVLNDLIESGCVKVVRLKDIFRQGKESMIVVNAHRINNGEMPILNEKGKDFFFIRCEDLQEQVGMLIDLVNTRLPKFNTSWDKVKHIQVLSPMKKGVLGILNLNKELQNVLNPPSTLKKEKEFKDYIFRVGDKVMQTKNNYSLKWERINEEGNKDGEKDGVGVFNGDVGYIENIDDETGSVSIIFDEEKRVIYDPIYLDELDLAYAVTVHKSQGSEFPVIVMPVYMGAPLLMNRNLFYTGITRAKQLVVLVGSPKAIAFMVNNNKTYERYSLLKWRIIDIISGVSSK